VSLNATAQFFFGNDTFRNFSVYGLTFLDIWDNNGTSNISPYMPCDTNVLFYANLTDSSNVSIQNATCNISFPDSSAIMIYNASSKLYTYNRSFDYSGSYDYNVTCNKSFYINSTGLEGLDVAQLQNLTLKKTMSSINDLTYLVTVSVVNGRSCPLRNVRAFDFVPANFTSYNYSTNKTYEIAATSPYYGNATYWQFNITSLQALSMTYMMNGSNAFRVADSAMAGLDPFN
jgi:hypothetical protein